VTIDLAVPRRALAIGAHPDDVEFGCGGTLAKWAAQGCALLHVVCTDGAKGTWDPSQDPTELVSRRQAEQRAASRALGGTGDVIFLGWPDGELEAGVRQRWQVVDAIRRFRPDVVLVHDPWKRYRLHPDHRNAGFLATDAIVAARDPLFFPELGATPHRPATLLLFEADEADHAEDVSAFFEAKLAALFAHESQLRSTMGIAADEGGQSSFERQRDAFVASLRERLARQGAPFGLALAETFKRIDDL
jgi:LmbE family N-acetylglucosaminyl deacetylase